MLEAMMLHVKHVTLNIVFTSISVH